MELMRGASRTLVFACASPLLVALAGCGSRSALDTGAGEAARVTGALPDAAVLGSDAGADATSCAADPLLCTPHVVLFGGFDIEHNTYLDDTWEWDGTAWTQQNVQGPSARAGHAMATLSGKVVLFGGGMTSALPASTMIEGGTLHDTWEWDGVTWTERASAQFPAERSGHAMATLDGKIVMFGGGVVGQAMSPPETWVWDGNTWTVASTTGPSARMGHTMTTVGDRVVLFGGTDEAGGALFDVWTWGGTAWTSVNTYGANGETPAARYGHAAAALGGELWVYGGYGHDWLDDLWSWDFNLWTEIPTEPDTPSARYTASMATLGESAVLFGGEVFPNTLDGSAYRWDGKSWSRQEGGPPPRAESAMATQ